MVGLNPEDDYGGTVRGEIRDLEKLDLERWRAGVLPPSHMAKAKAQALDWRRGQDTSTSTSSTSHFKDPIDSYNEHLQTAKKENDPTPHDSSNQRSAARQRLPWWKRRPLVLFNLSPRALKCVWIFNITVFGYLLFTRPCLVRMSRKPIETQVAYLTHPNPLISTPWHWVLASSEASREYGVLEGRKELDLWIGEEKKLAWEKIAGNIGPSAGAVDGIVIASPSTGDVASEPDYYYTWTRDAALTISSLLPSFLPSEYERPWEYRSQLVRPNETLPDQPFLEPFIRAYVQSQSEIQMSPNPSGDLWTGGLNEPKFYVDGSRFDGDWGRPQRDGPALRALATIPYAHFLLDRGWSSDLAYVEEKLYDPTALRQAGSVIKNDLEEVGGGWWLESFDLWEEVSGHHLFTLLACLRALQAGAILADRLDDPKAAEFYAAQSDKIADILPAFWDDELYWRSTARIDIETSGEEQSQEDRAWLDCTFPLAVIHAGSDDLFGAHESETLTTLWRYIKSFEGMYRINEGPVPSARTSHSSLMSSTPHSPGPWRDGWAVGRYKEDVYNGIGFGKGNPWYICTNAVANVLYLAKENFERQGHISLNNLTRPFWSDLLGDKYCEAQDMWTVDRKGPRQERLFGVALKALVDAGDQFMRIGQAHAPGGRMSEQIDRDDGTNVGARDLTWSYASFLEAARARARAGR